MESLSVGVSWRKKKMGNNYRFKLSELIPNAWFYKLRDMANSKPKPKPKPIHTLPPPRRSSHTSRPPKSPGVRLRHRPTVSSSTTSGDSTATGTGSFSPEFRSDQVLLQDEPSLHSPCCSKTSKAATFTPPPELDLRPIITKPANKPAGSMRKAAVSSPAGVKLRMRSPRIMTRKSVSNGARRRGSTATAKAAAVVKTSVDPKKDFKESMEEMIKENNIRESKDLEDLLACYLSLNSNEYHHIIINVFKQIWIDLNLN